MCESNDELKIFNKFNPFPGTKTDDSILFQERKKKYRLYGWIIDSSTKSVNMDEFRDIYLTGKSISAKLRTLGWSPQLYYDSVILGISSIDERPRCSICGQELKFDCIDHGYPKTCSKECHKILKAKQIVNNSKMTKKGDIVPEERRIKIKNTLQSIPKDVRFNEQWRQKHSQFMKSFAKTEKGIEFYKKVGEIVSKRNIERLVSEDDYFKNKHFSRGIYESVLFNKNIRYDSGWELIFIKYIENLSKEKNIVDVFDRCKDYILYNWDDGSSHRYLPDFFIKFNNGTKLIIEIKPKYLLMSDRKTQLSTSAGEKYFKNKKVKYCVITEDDFLSGKEIKPSFNIEDYI